MLQDRGYLVADDQLNLTKDALKNKICPDSGDIQGSVFNCEHLNNLFKKKGDHSAEDNPEEET